MNPEHYIAQLKHPQLIVCRQCKIAVGPRMINNHFQEMTHRLLKPVRDVIVQQVRSWDQLIQDSEQLNMPRFTLPLKFELLKGFDDELKCTYDRDQCEYICRNADRMRRHVRETHQVIKYLKKRRSSLRQQKQHDESFTSGKRVMCQRFFISEPKSSFFEMTSKRQPRIVDRIVFVGNQVTMQLSQRREKIEIEAMRIIVEKNVHEVSPGIERAGGIGYLIDMKRDKLLKFIDPFDPETKLMLQEIGEVMNEMIQISQRTVITRAGIFVRMKIMRTEEHQSRY